MSSPAALIEDVSDTARWVAFHRALESERPDALFQDPFARRLAGERGRRIAEGMPSLPWAQPGLGGLTWSLGVKTRVFDDLILDSIQSLNADAVLNLAAGLDARPYRLPLPSSLVWIEVDRGPLIDAKAEVLDGAKPACTVHRITADLSDKQARQRLLDQVADAHARVVVVTEGLLVYLDEALVGALADELRARPSMQRWVLESVAPGTFKRHMRVWGPILSRGHAAWKFAPEGGFDFFRPHGWTPLQRRPFIAEARRLGRDEMRHAWLLRVLSALSKRFRRQLESSVVYGVLQPAPS